MIGAFGSCEHGGVTAADRFDDASMVDRRERRDDPALWCDASAHGMVVTAHYRATAAGLAVLETGGNAIDAAVAAALAVGVCEPAGSGLGGMAMLMIHLASEGRTFAVEGPCRAPRHATPEEVGAGPRKHGYRAVAVPTNVATLAHARREFGTMSEAELLAPAIALARDGVVITPQQNRLIGEYRSGLVKGNAAATFVDGEGEPLAVGARLRQPVLAGTLERLRDAGFEDYYRGEIGRAIARDMAENGGFVHEDDLRDIPWPTVRAPVVGRFGDTSVHTLAPPGGGKALLQILQLLDALGAGELDPDAPRTAVLLAMVIRRARQDRRRYRRGGPQAPDLGSLEYAASIAPELAEALAADPAVVGLGPSGTGETSHICTVDRAGNAVALTQSIERSFGSKVATPELGFLYNGYMQALKVQDVNHPHYLRPGAVARSNAVPTVVLRDGRVYAALGSTGSERIASALSQVLLRLRRGASAYAAVAAPRLHCTPEGEVLVEADRMAPGVLLALERHGFSLRRLDAWSFTMGGLQLVVRQDDRWHGASEPRRDGAAAGPARPPRGAPSPSNVRPEAQP